MRTAAGDLAFAQRLLEAASVLTGKLLSQILPLMKGALIADIRYLFSTQNISLKIFLRPKNFLMFDISLMHIWAPQSAVMSNNIWIQLNVSSQP